MTENTVLRVIDTGSQNDDGECSTPKFKAKEKGNGSPLTKNNRTTLLQELNRNYHGEAVVKGIAMQPRQQQEMMGGVMGGEMQLTLGQKLPVCYHLIRHPRRLKRTTENK